MTISTTKLRAAISLTLALAVMSVFTLSTFAASKRTAPGKNSFEPAAKSLADALVGKLIGTGRFSIDGDVVPSGTTVFSGSVIATGQDGNATVDLGQLGRLELRPNTTVSLVLSSNSVQVVMSGEGSMVQWLPSGVEGQVKTSAHVRFLVTRGQAEVKSARMTRKLSAGEAETYNEPAEAVASGDAVLIAESGRSRDKAGAASTSSAPSRTVSAGPLGVAVLTGLAGGVAWGVLANRNDHANPSTLPKPSTVVP
jgi:hypothetical protein